MRRLSDAERPPEGERCPLCSGIGTVFVQLQPDQRSEIACPNCGGSGKFSDALAQVLETGKPLIETKPKNKCKGWWETK